MDLDELHPGGGFYTPEPPKEQQERRAQELESTGKSLPILEELFADFDELIKSTDSIKQLEPGSQVSMEAQILALKKLNTFAKREKAKFTAKYKNYIKATS